MRSLAWMWIYLSFAALPASHLQTSRAFQPGDILPQPGSQPPTEADKEFARKFDLIRMANGVTPDGFTFSENTYKGPDGEKVYFRVFHYHPAERARVEFESRIKTASKIVDRVQAKGGGQMVILLTPNENKKQLSVILVYAEDDFRSVQSSSFDDIKRVAEMLKASQKARETNPH